MRHLSHSRQFDPKGPFEPLRDFLVFHVRKSASAIAKLWLPVVIFPLLSGCVSTGMFSSSGSGSTLVGPGSSSEIIEDSSNPPLSASGIHRELEVIIPVFDPNIPENSSVWEKQGIWPELRRVESVNFALRMKKALEDTRQTGAVRVTPDTEVVGDLYVIGRINESNGEDVDINIRLVSIGGETWLNKNYKHRVDEYSLTSVRTKNKNPYDPVFEQAAADIAKKLRAKKQDQLEGINQLTEVRFGHSMSDDSFAQFLEFRGDRVKLVRSPADQDPMFKRIHQYRVEDQLFTDQMQQHYYHFDSRVSEAYGTWQESAFAASKARREAQAKAGLQTFVAILAIGLGAAAAANSSSDDGYSTAGTVAAVSGITAGAVLLNEGMQNYKEAKFHHETLMELGKSVDVEVAPQVIEFEEKTIELTGDATAQFNQWRIALKRIYAEEQTPGERL